MRNAIFPVSILGQDFLVYNPLFFPVPKTMPPVNHHHRAETPKVSGTGDGDGYLFGHGVVIPIAVIAL